MLSIFTLLFSLFLLKLGRAFRSQETSTGNMPSLTLVRNSSVAYCLMPLVIDYPHSLLHAFTHFESWRLFVSCCYPVQKFVNSHLITDSIHGYSGCFFCSSIFGHIHGSCHSYLSSHRPLKTSHEFNVSLPFSHSACSRAQKSRPSLTRICKYTTRTEGMSYLSSSISSSRSDLPTLPSSRINHVGWSNWLVHIFFTSAPFWFFE